MWFGADEDAHSRLVRTPKAAVAAVKPGKWAKVTGTVDAIQLLMKSAVEEEACIGFRLIVQEMRGELWKTVLEKMACDPFAIRDDSGRARVEGPSLLVLDADSDWAWLTPRSFGLLEGTGVAKPGWFDHRRFRYREALLKPGDRVRVLGLALLEPDPTEPPAGFRAPAFSLALRGSDDEPIVVADAARRLSGAARPARS